MERKQSTDAELVAETLAGNREAFGHLYDRYARLVRAVVCATTSDWPMAQDMTQESFLRAYRKLAGLREPARFGAWIVGIARQVSRERRRGLSRDRHEFVGEALEVDFFGNDVGAVDDADEMQFIIAKTALLDERERLAIHVFFLEGRDARRCAELLQVSRSGMYALLGRALARLAALVEKRESEKGTN